MISHPGEILAHFGRYEAVEDLGPSGAAHLWRAWDPFLDRFVVVVVLANTDAQEVHDGLRNLDRALAAWTGGKYTHAQQVLDFAPADDDPAFFVCSETPLAASDTEPSEPPSRLRPVARAEDVTLHNARPPSAASPRDEPPPKTTPSGSSRPTYQMPPSPPPAAGSGLRWIALVAAAVVGVGLLGVTVRYLVRDEPLPALRPTPAPQVAKLNQVVPTLPLAVGNERPAPPRPPSVEQAPSLQPSGEPAAPTDQPGNVQNADAHPTAAGVALPAETAPKVAAADAHVVRPSPEAQPATRGRGEDHAAPETIELQGQPEQTTVSIAANDARDFAVEARGRRDLQYEWRLNGRVVAAQTPKYRLRGDDLGGERQGRLEAAALDTNGRQVASRAWTLKSVEAPAVPAIRIEAPGEAITGKTVKLIAHVQIRAPHQCEWSIDGKWQTAVCEGFDWSVPADQPARPVKVTLKVTALDRSTSTDATVKIRRAETLAAVTSTPVKTATPPTPSMRAVDTAVTAGAPVAAGAPNREVARGAVLKLVKEHFEKQGTQPDFDFQLSKDPEPQGDHYVATGILTVRGSGSTEKRLELRRQGAEWIASGLK